MAIRRRRRRSPPSRALDQALARYDGEDTAHQIEVLAQRIGELATEIALCSQKVDGVETTVGEMQGEITEIKRYADRWKGGFYTIAGLGAALGTLIAMWDKIPKLWGHP